MSDKDRLELPSLKLEWNEKRTERLLSNVHQRLQRRQRIVRTALIASPLALILCFFAITRIGGDWSSMRASRVASSPILEANAIYLRDGSKMVVDPSTSEVRITETSDARVGVEVVRGAGRFSVVPNAHRVFEVRAGSVTVTVVGTEFVVERRGETTWVEVSRGKVRVSWSEDQTFLVAGESGTFPRVKLPSSSATTDVPSVASAAPADEGLAGRDDGQGRDEIDGKGARVPQAKQMYRARVARKDYRGAYAVLAHNPALAGDTVEDLLVAADVARLSDHPSEAVPYLQRVIREHPRDERAPLAAFTLGRTLGGLGRTEEAMNMFGRVHSAWPKSPLAEDALVRQAEAASQLADVAAARRIAEQYDRDYPSGRRRSEVRRYARLE